MLTRLYHLAPALLLSLLVHGKMVAIALAIPAAFAQSDPLGDASEIGVPDATNDPKGQIRSAVLGILLTVLNFMGLAAVVVIVIAGIGLVIGLGSDESATRAKKIVLYAVIGLILILISSAIVRIVIGIAD